MPFDVSRNRVDRRLLAAGALTSLAAVLPTGAVAADDPHARFFKPADAPSLTAAGSADKPYNFAGPTTQLPCRLEEHPLCGNINVFMNKRMKRVKQVLLGLEAPCQTGKYIGGAVTLRGFKAKK